VRFRHFGYAGPWVDRWSDAVAALGSPRRRRTRRSGPREAPRRSREGGRPVPESLHRKPTGALLALVLATAGAAALTAHDTEHPFEQAQALYADAEHQGGRAAQRKDGSSRAAGDKRHLHPRLSCLISWVLGHPAGPRARSSRRRAIRGRSTHLPPAQPVRLRGRDPDASSCPCCGTCRRWRADVSALAPLRFGVQ
jgi:hypothetical protein